MKKLSIILFAIVALSISSCDKQNSTANKLEGKWLSDEKASSADFVNPEDYKQFVIFSDVDENSGLVNLEFSNTEFDVASGKVKALDTFSSSAKIAFSISGDNAEIFTTGTGSSASSSLIDLKGKKFTLTDGTTVMTYTKQ